MLTLVELSDVVGRPRVKMDLPSVTHGSRVQLRFRLERLNGGRSEILVVDGQFRVMAVGLDAATMPQRQLLSVESVNASPSWKAVKRTAPWKRVLPVAKASRRIIEG